MRKIIEGNNDVTSPVRSRTLSDGHYDYRCACNGEPGAYSVIDKDGYHYTNFDKRFLVKSLDNNKADEPLVPVKHADIIAQMDPEDAEEVNYLLGITMTYDGHIVAAAGGAVLLVDRNLKLVDYAMFPGEKVENSVAEGEALKLGAASHGNL